MKKRAIRPPVPLRYEAPKRMKRVKQAPPKPKLDPRCPRCRKVVNWDNIEGLENDMTVYVQEKLYYCPHCGAILGVASWHSIG